MGFPAVPEWATVTVSRYVPARMKQVSPATATVAHFWIVLKGLANVPGLVSLPLIAT